LTYPTAWKHFIVIHATIQEMADEDVTTTGIKRYNLRPSCCL